MASQPGKDILIKIADGAPSTFVTIAGLRTKRMSFNAQAVDITDSDSAGHWRELLDGSGIRRASISGSGVFRDQQSDELLRARFFSASNATLQFVIPDFGTIEGPFRIMSLEYSGSHDGEVTFEAAFESAGELAFGAQQ